MMRAQSKRACLSLLWALPAMLGACAGSPASQNRAVQPAIAVRPVAMPGLGDEIKITLRDTAQAALAEGRCEAAIDPLQKLIWDKADDEAVRVELADCLLALGRIPDAAAHYAKISGPRALAGQALTDIALGQSKDAELALNAALEVNLSDIRLWNALGHFYDTAGRHMDAQDTYIRALAAGADHGIIVNNIGMSLLMQGRYAEAQDKFTQALDIDPDSRTFDVNRRLSLALLGDYDAAMRFVHPDDAPQIYNDAGYIAMQRGQRPLARALFTLAMEVSPVYFETADKNLETLMSSRAP